MKEKYKFSYFAHAKYYKVLRIMKISTFMLFLCIFTISAGDIFSQKTEVSLSLKNVTLKKAISEIENSSDYVFLITDEAREELNSKTTIVTNKESINSILDDMLNNTNLDYSITGRQVSIYKSSKLASEIKKKTEEIESVQQKKKITGSVTDENGEPVIGANIVETGVPSNGTVTDIDGNFTLSVDNGSIIAITYLGYLDQKISVAGKTNINIVLVEDSKTLDEVVVVGYGSTNKRRINSSVSTLPMDNVAAIPVASINDAIAGRVHGVIVTSSTGAPGSKAAVSIRGGATPLYVIDNMIRSQNDFQNLNPNDIETYSVLKDAAATALYGAQGGNGVILVTTKSGNEGKTSINYSFNQIWSQPTIFPKRLGSYDHLNALNQVYIAEGLQQPTPDDDLEKYRTQSDPYLFPNTDWQKIGLKSVAPEQRHDLAITAGSKLLRYYASGSYFNQGTLLKTDNNYNDRVTYRLNTVSDFENINLKVKTGLDGYVETNSIPISSTAGGYGQIFQHIQQSKPYSLAYNEFGLPYNGTSDNPAVELSNLSGYNKGTSRVFNSILELDYAAPFLDGLHIKALGSYNMWNSKNKSWNATAPSYALNSTTPILGNPPRLTGIRGDGSSAHLQGIITYTKAINDHFIDFTGVYEYAQNKSGSLSATRQQYQIIYDQFVAGPTVNQLANGSESESVRAGYIGRLSYNYAQKYFFDGTIRYDGLDLFPTDNQWGTFYALSGGYTISEEKFMQRFKDNHSIDHLKVRGSVGLVGTADGIGSFQYISGYNINPNAWVINGIPMQGSSEPGSLPSTNFSWYSVNERNIGLDYAALNNRLTATIDYFYKRTTGYVVGDTRYSAVLGIGLPPINFKDGALRRHGTEFNVTWNDRVQDFTYKIGVNFTQFNQLWERDPNEDDAALKNPYTRNSGSLNQSLSTGYYSKGFYTNNSDLLNDPRRISSLNVVAGDLQYQDVNGDGKIDGADQHRIGSNTFPRINFGTTIDLGYKGWALSAVVMGSGNRDRYLGGIVQGGSAQNKLVYEFQKDYWRPDNQDALFPRQVSEAGVNGSNNFVSSDFWILPSRFVRLKYLQLGYDFKTGALKNSPFSTIRLFVSGTNLLTFSNSKKYFIDPESSQDNENYPIQKTISVGFNIGF